MARLVRCPGRDPMDGERCKKVFRNERPRRRLCPLALEQQRKRSGTR